MKEHLRKLAKKTLLRPTWVQYSSQTIYQCLFGCVRMWEATGDGVWQERAEQVMEILCGIQCSDGGFDIGYEFDFGMLHRKGEATSPELLGLAALALYGRAFGVDRVRQSARGAADWIRRHAIALEPDSVTGESRYAMPYAPHSTRRVMIYNATSMTAGALGCYLGYIERNPELLLIYRGMVEYAHAALQSDPQLPGRFWYYADQSRNDLPAETRNIIDYYHQMQQVELHALAEQALSAAKQKRVIKDASDHILAVHRRHEVLPYTNCQGAADRGIHAWGLASVVPGLLEAARVVAVRAEAYHGAAREIIDWMLAKVWNGEYFIPVLEPDGAIKESEYGVRSEAWVFNALAAAEKYLGHGAWTPVAEACFARIAAANFSGPEYHASTPWKRAVVAVYKRVRGL